MRLNKSNKSINLRFLSYIIPSVLLLLIILFFAFNHITSNIIDSLSERFLTQKVFYDRSQLTQPLLQEIVLARKLAHSNATINWALDEEHPQLRKQGIAELESFRQVFQDRSYFFVINKSRNYYFNDAKNQYDGSQLRYTLSSDNDKDAWYFATIKNPKECQLNVNNDRELDVTNVWINCLVKSDNQVIGVIGTGINLTHFINSIVANGSDGVVNMFIDPSGAIQAHPNIKQIDFQSIAKDEKAKKTIFQLLDSENEQEKLRQLLVKTKNKPQTVQSLYAAIDGHKTLVGVSYLKEFDWFNISLVKPKSWTLGDLFLPLTLLVLAGVILTIILTAWLNHHIVLRRLFRLSDAIEKVKKHSQKHLEIIDKDDDEISVLTKNFVDMARSIEEQQKQLIQAKKQAEKANELKKQFLSNLSHETRTPISIIMGMTDLALKKETSPKIRNYLEKSKNSANNLYSLIEKVLEYTEIESGKLTAEYITFPLISIKEDLQDSYSTLSSDKKITFTVSQNAHCPAEVTSDRNLLIKVLNELLENAFKFTHEGGSVSLDIDCETDENNIMSFHFKIKDTGIGISQEKQEDLFGLFMQVDGSNTRSYGGIGLGLIYVKSLIEIMDGKIWVESELGHGSTFHITIPFNPK